MICPTHKIIFLHPPKTAGTSITLALLRADAPDVRIQSRYPYVNSDVQKQYLINQNDWQHLTLDEIHGLRPETKGWPSFGLTRHPYSRAVSEYFYQQRMKTTTAELNESIVTGSLWRTGFARHDWPQDRYFGEDSYYWAFESLPQIWTEICDVMGISKVPLKHSNRSSPVDASSLLSQEAKHVIRTKFAADFDRWKFSE